VENRVAKNEKSMERGYSQSGETKVLRKCENGTLPKTKKVDLDC
jgi:hypothetical protein